MLEKIKEIVENSDRDIQEVEISDGKDIPNIKNNFTELAEYFLSAFNEIRKFIKDSNDEEINKFRNKYEPIAMKIASLSQYKNYKNEFGKSQSRDKLIMYVNDNYYSIIDFIDLFLGVIE